VLKSVPGRHYALRKGDTTVVLNCDTVPLSDDVTVRVGDRDGISAEPMFSFRINLRFLDLMHHPEDVHARARTWSQGSADSRSEQQSSSSGPDRRVNVSGSTISAPRSIRALLLPFRRMGLGGKPAGQPVSPGGGSTGSPSQTAAPNPNLSEWIVVKPTSIERRVNAVGPAQAGEDTLEDDLIVRASAVQDEEEEDEGLDSDVDEPAERPLADGEDPLTAAANVDDDSSVGSPVPPGIKAGTAVSTANPVILAPTPSADESSSTGAADVVEPSSGTASAALEPYIAKRVRVVLTKADLDMDRPDRIPDDFTVTLYFREPRLRRNTREELFGVRPPAGQPHLLQPLGSRGSQDMTLTNMPLVASTNPTLTNVPLNKKDS